MATDVGAAVNTAQAALMRLRSQCPTYKLYSNDIASMYFEMTHFYQARDLFYVLPGKNKRKFGDSNFNLQL